MRAGRVYGIARIALAGCLILFVDSEGTLGLPERENAGSIFGDETDR